MGRKQQITRGARLARDDLSDLTDEELLLARDQVLDEFATALEMLHIACGAPPKLALKKQADKDGRCPLPTSTLSEVFNGKKLPGLDFTMELIRQLRPDDAGLQDEWRARWAEAKYTTTQAAKAQKRLEKDADQARDRAAGAIDRLREETAAELQRASLLRAEAEKALTEAQAEADAMRAEANEAARKLIDTAKAEAEALFEQAHAKRPPGPFVIDVDPDDWGRLQQQAASLSSKTVKCLVCNHRFSTTQAPSVLGRTQCPRCDTFLDVRGRPTGN
ncbi:ATP synthase F0 subunit B (plasmid) [Streptomyces phaeoluteigriseus]|uniref:ATP synthase F0 subunit B n=1 Tax=Streptomyces phaeoluteigriseus TaxID=114686 RepID=A0ABY4ZLK1_9ACTN|nr:ATP synthase F0 subunit B [Streptomyces phaeoluteigriseus]USQ89876.1 ATP synthase F0 subunit B [Streptomyces phaeoluteigriseus]